MAVAATAGRALPPLPPPRTQAPGSRPAPSVRLNAVITAREDLTDSVARFRVRPDDPMPPIRPGQYLALGLILDGRIVQRPYSTAIATGPDEELEFLIRLVPNGTFTPLLWDLGVGTRVRIGPPRGSFTRIPGDRRTHLFVATGTGLAPFVAMLGTLFDEPDPPRTVAIHGVAQVGELAYRDRFERWQAGGLATYVPSLSRPSDPVNAGWTGRTGRVDTILADVCDAHGLEPRDTVAYLCGHPEMIAAAERILTRRGLPADAIRSEHYWPAG
jgi:NAD(P)H-flavin reductase